MRRWLPLVALLCLASCQPGGDARTVLRVANWGGAGGDTEYEKTVKSLLRQFESENPGVRVQIENIPGEYVQKMLLNHVAGSMPDVMVVDASSAAQFLNNGILSDLVPFAQLEEGDFLGQYFPNVVDTFRRGEKVHAIPNDFTPMVVYYNKDLFDEAGQPYPKASWTPEEFRQAAIALTKPEKKQYGFVLANWMPGWAMWLWNFGGDIMGPDEKAVGTFDSEQNVKAITFLRDLVKQDKAAPTLSEAAALGADPFADGKAAMAISGHWGLIGFKASKKINWKRLGVVELPHWPSQSTTVLYMSGYGIPEKAKHKDLAWKFIKLWTSYAAQKRYNATGIAVCGRKDVAYERADIGNPQPDDEQSMEREFLRIVPQGRPPYGSRIEGYAIVEKLGQSAMDSILNNSGDVKTVLTETAKKIDREFAKRI